MTDAQQQTHQCHLLWVHAVSQADTQNDVYIQGHQLLHIALSDSVYPPNPLGILRKLKITEKYPTVSGQSDKDIYTQISSTHK